MPEFCDYPGVPHYFKRLVEVPRPNVVSLIPSDGLTVYGLSLPAGSAHEVEDMRVFEMSGRFPASCFSRICPQPEFGYVPLDEAIEIDHAEFMAAVGEFCHE